MANTNTLEIPTGGCDESSLHSPAGRAQCDTECDVAVLARLVADALKNSVSELRKDDGVAISKFTETFQKEFAAFREGEEKLIARFEEAIKVLKPKPISTDPITHFWTSYKKVADEHDHDMVAQYLGDLDTSLLFAGLFSAISATFIAQIIPSVQPDPSDLTNALLLRILQRNASFDGADPLAPVTKVPASAVAAQSILFASLVVTLFVAFIAVLGKQWILHYTRASTWGSIVDRGMERQAKFEGLQKWGLHFVMESLPVMLQLALLLFSIGLVVLLLDLNVSSAKVVLAIICIGFVFYASIAVAAMVWEDCPFQTPLSVLFPKVLARAKEIMVPVWRRLRHQSKRLSAALQHRVEPLAEDAGDSDTFSLLNPAYWRHEPIFTPLPPVDTSASAGFWLLENSTSFSAATAIAAVFQEFQWPSNYSTPTALLRFRGTYMECFQKRELDKPTRLKALQAAAAYYVLYHTQLIWSASRNSEAGMLSGLDADLVLKDVDQWGQYDLFEYILHAEDRSDPVTSVQFLSYIAPFWFCGDAGPALRFRPSRLGSLEELIQVLEASHALVPSTLTDCVLSLGAAMDFPLHPDDMIRVDKGAYFQLAFKMVVEHIWRLAVGRRSRRVRYAGNALEIVLTLAGKQAAKPLDVVWINKLLWNAVDMDNEKFVYFLRLRELAGSGEDQSHDQDRVTNREVHSGHLGGTITSETPPPEYTSFSKISKNIEICSKQERGWEDKAVYGGLLAIQNLFRLGVYLPEVSFLETLSDAMNESKPIRVRLAAYTVILTAQDVWLRSVDLREKLKTLDFPRQMCSVVCGTCRADHQTSFLNMMEILSQDKYWHSYLRETMDLWLPFRREGWEHVIRIFSNITDIQFPEVHNPNDDSLVDHVTQEWARVPGPGVRYLSTDQLEQLAGVTKHLRNIVFHEIHRKDVLAVVKGVVLSLQNRRNDGQEGVGEGIRCIVDDLLVVLQVPIGIPGRCQSAPL